MYEQAVSDLPASKEFVAGIAEILWNKYEIAYIEKYHTDDAILERSGIVGHYTFYADDLFHSLTSGDVTFRWNAKGNLVSTPLKSEAEWLEWQEQL